jgi:hypothetical protein
MDIIFLMDSVVDDNTTNAIEVVDKQYQNVLDVIKP